MLLESDYAHDDSNFYGCVGLRLAFDSTKSPDYKVVRVGSNSYYIGSSEFTIYEMTKGCSVWSIKYIVDTDDFMTPLPEGWSIRYIVWSLVLEEREEDSFLVMNLSEKFNRIASDQDGREAWRHLHAAGPSKVFHQHVTSLKRLKTPEDIASATAFLAFDEASYITGGMIVVA
ncbi:DNA-directed DNA polymerase [Tanacetum coccineum]|uniref:DNA-directed DNA polymerase n=1 Tax=Tanacetum coccineum TaxID=301880 RepID=A0ABQ5BDJ0_9ASTR